MIDPIAFFEPGAAAVMARPIYECGLSPSLASKLSALGIPCAGRLLGVTTRQLMEWHERGPITIEDLSDIDAAICRLSCDIAQQVADARRREVR